MIQLRYYWWNWFLNNFSLLIGLMRLVCLLTMVGTYSSWSVIIDQMNVGIQFLMKYVLQQQFLYCFTCSSNQILIFNILSFLFFFFWTFLLINWIFLCLNPWIFCHLATSCLFGFDSFMCFSGFWLPCINRVMCHACRK